MDSFGVKLITAPAAEPVTLAAAKARLAVTITDMDTDITSLIVEARTAAESECGGGRAFVTQTLSLYLDGFPHGRTILIPRPPLQSVTWVKYYDVNGVQQTFSSSNYYVAIGKEPGRIVLKSSASWPTTEAGRPEPVEVRFIAGYGDNATDVPANVRAAIILIVADRFESPAGGDVDIPPAARRLLNGVEPGQVW